MFYILSSIVPAKSLSSISYIEISKQSEKLIQYSCPDFKYKTEKNSIADSDRLLFPVSTGGQTNEEFGTKSAIYVASALNRTPIKPVFTNTHLWTGDKRTHTGIPANVRINFEAHQDVQFGTLLNWKEKCRYPDDYVVFLANKYNTGRKWDIGQIPYI